MADPLDPLDPNASADDAVVKAVSDIVDLAAKALGPMILEWVRTNNQTAIEALKAVLPSAEIEAALDAAVVAAQRQKQDELFADRE